MDARRNEGRRERSAGAPLKADRQGLPTGTGPGSEINAVDERGGQHTPTALHPVPACLLGAAAFSMP
jgi:hypothetical protein